MGKKGQKKQQAKKLHKTTTIQIYVVSFLEPVNATRKIGPTDVSRLYSKLMIFIFYIRGNSTDRKCY